MDKKEKLKKLINLLGIPSILETGFVVGGRNGREIVNEKTGERTGYSIGGKTRHQIVSRDGEVIGSVSGDNRIYCEGIMTNYRIGGITGRRILYLKPARTAL